MTADRNAPSEGTSLWLVRSDATAVQEQRAIQDGVVWIDAGIRSDLSECFEYGQVLDAVWDANPGETATRAESLARQVHGLIHEAQIGDLAISPMKRAGTIAIGQFLPDIVDIGDGLQGRAIRWIRTDLPSGTLLPDLGYSTMAKQKFARITRNNALERIRTIMRGGEDPGNTASASDPLPDDPEVLRDMLRQRIAARIGSVFSGHGMATLAGEILRARGYDVRISPPGPDGGVDIYAGKGDFGGEKSLIVQVKSGDDRTGHEVLQRLEGAMSASGATQGLMISWSGYTRDALARRDQLWFRLRMWSSMDLVEAFLEVYDRLPAHIRDLVPLQRVWTI